jgi:thiol:disulfide interchange protein DsbC
MISKWFAGLALGFCLAGGALADTAGTPKGGAGEEAVRKALAARFPGTEVQSVVKTAYGDLYEVVVDRQLFYTDGKAGYFLVGNLIDAKSGKNLTEERLRTLMRVKFETLPFDSAIKIVKGNGSRKLAVFSDPDCPFCKKLEAELKEVTDVTIYVFLYPIPTLHPQAADKARAVWCASDRAKAWEELMLKGVVPPAGAGCEAPLEKIAATGAKLRVTGTPTLIFADGRLVPGMIPAAQLEKYLGGAGAK